MINWFHTVHIPCCIHLPYYNYTTDLPLLRQVYNDTKYSLYDTGRHQYTDCMYATNKDMCVNTDYNSTSCIYGNTSYIRLAFSFYNIETIEQCHFGSMGGATGGVSYFGIALSYNSIRSNQHYRCFVLFWSFFCVILIVYYICWWCVHHGPSTAHQHGPFTVHPRPITIVN